MKTLFRNTALLIGLLLGLADSFAEDFDPNVQARNSLRLTLEEHGAMPQGKPTTQGIEEQAAHLMLIKNAMSLYRDGYLEQQDAQTIANLLKNHLEYTTAALAGASSWPQEKKQLLRTMHYHALAVDQLIRTPKNSPYFKGMMGAYQTGIGYDAYRAAQKAGIPQYWEEAR